ncbi:MAG: TetR/AcrR family transcriptional regulator [Lachnospiraceae bacterium]|nr:TetR/AcrR family transcriptional regulator [Lachnospiraceae bacterium]
MNEKFFDLSRLKQDRMINGALEVFAKNGFKHASTDDMVKAVDVSKGLWFHYFGSKLGLYTFVYGYSVKYMILELASAVDEKEKNYFEIMKQIEYAKMKISKSYPYMTRFLERALEETDTEIMEQTAEDRRIYQEKVAGLGKNGEIPEIADKAKREKIKKMAHYTIEGIVKDKAQSAEPETVYKEIKNYLDLLRSMVAMEKRMEEGLSIDSAAS